MLWISWQARTQSPQRTHLFWSRTSSWSKQMRSLRRLRPCCHEIQSIGAIDFAGRGLNHGAWLDHESFLLILSWLRGLRPMCTRMSMDIRVHIGRNPRNQHEGSSKTLSTSSLTINAPLIVKDEVDKVFELILSNKTKILCGLKAYCYLGPACPGALEGPRDRRVHDYFLIE